MHKISGRARVAFQGEPGAFSQMAARKLLGTDVATVPCATFEAMFEAIAQGKADLILAPLENTLAGPVLRCYDLLYQSHLRMTGEVVLRISHCVIGVPGAKLDEVRKIQSHPVALAQCEKFFATHPRIAKSVAEDTAGSVRQVMEQGDETVAAIAGGFAAEEYGAEVLAEGVEDDASNFTRFALLEPAGAMAEPDEAADACTLVLTVTNRPGALFHALEPFSANGVDLMSLVSRPLVGEPWHYRFFLEVAASASDARMKQALLELEPRAVELRVLGSYRSGK
ncbi:MAG: prephenate dehydratase [Acidobacteriota bacterium]|nr:prephenate dehydratase [Acidobacteriota bacterium]